jgi:exodeoxyribonuclease V alpha subunit
MDISYTPEQLVAINAATNTKHRIVGISGPAGSGKTTIIKEAARRLTDLGRSVVLAAPTGRAARRMYEATGIRASTVHRLLEYGKPIVDPETGIPYEDPRPARNYSNPVPYDDVIIDEYAMVNWRLHRALIAAMRCGNGEYRAARLLCFGDVAQLEPIEPYHIKTQLGTPFEDILSYKSAVRLTEIHRQAEGSGVLSNASRIRQGLAPRRFDDFDILYYEMMRKAPLEAVTWFLKQTAQDYSTLQSQFITPSREGGLGSKALNNTIQSMYRGPGHIGYNLPRPKGKKPIACRVDVGEKIICNENTYDMRDFRDRYSSWRSDVLPHWDSFTEVPEEFMMLNGEIGTISGIEPDGTILIDMLDRTVQVPPSITDYNFRGRNLYTKDCRQNLDLAYAITTHKMQGNEVDNVCYLLHRYVMDNATRNNLYTAVTRAKRKVTILTDNGGLTTAVKRTPAMMDDIRERRKDQKGWSIS